MTKPLAYACGSGEGERRVRAIREEMGAARIDRKIKTMTLLFALLAGALLGGCSRAPSFLEGPSVEANPNPAVPLAAVVRFSAEGAVSTTIQVTDGEHDWDLLYDESHNPADGLAVVGMRPERKHAIRVTIRDSGGAETAAPEALEFTTPPLPRDAAEFPPLEVRVSKPEEMEPGVTLFNPRRRRIGDNRFGTSFGMLLALDAAGEVVWYYRIGSRISDFEKLRNGNLIFVTQDFRLVEIDWLGNPVNTWYASGRPQGPAEGVPVDTLTFHHEVDELPNGNLIVLGSEMREIDDYYTSEDNADAPRKKQMVMGDVIVEFERETGKVVWSWNAFDYMDPFRIGYETFGGYWERRGFPGVVDWSHANNLLYYEKDDSLLINFRYQAAVMKIDHRTGEVRWIFGEPGGWGKLEDKVLKIKGETRRPFHQHSPSPTPRGTLMIFDNGNFQARPFTPPKPPSQTYTRAVEYAIDEETMTVKEVWASEGPGPEQVLSFAMGDVDWLPETENVLVAYGAVLPRESVAEFNWKNALRFNWWTRVREYKRSEPPEVVWEVVLDRHRGEEPLGWALFGAERLPRVGP